MRSLNALLLLTLALDGCHTSVAKDPIQSTPPLQDQTGAPNTLQVSSPDFEADGPLDVRYAFNQFGCVGENVAPRVEWSSVPEGTQSLAVIVHDPDAPTGVGFFHRVVVNLPPSTRHLGGDLPAGAQDLHTDYGAPGYGGPCPPPGAPHRYVFSVYALDLPRLEVPAGATGALIRFSLLGHTLALGRLVGTYAR